jgi:hypothetical protein
VLVAHVDDLREHPHQLSDVVRVILEEGGQSIDVPDDAIGGLFDDRECDPLCLPSVVRILTYQKWHDDLAIEPMRMVNDRPEHLGDLMGLTDWDAPGGLPVLRWHASSVGPQSVVCCPTWQIICPLLT